jgi:hypothetical protein
MLPRSLKPTLLGGPLLLLLLLLLLLVAPASSRLSLTLTALLPALLLHLPAICARTTTTTTTCCCCFFCHLLPLIPSLLPDGFNGCHGVSYWSPAGPVGESDSVSNTASATAVAAATKQHVCQAVAAAAA